MQYEHKEYPRPQFRREEWQNLNGEWEFAFDDKNEGIKSGLWQGNTTLPLKINVPFPMSTPRAASGMRRSTTSCGTAARLRSPKETGAGARSSASTPPITKRMYG